jgi:hypothetical protein
VGARPKPQLSTAEAKVLVRQPSSDDAKAARFDPVSSCLERGWQRRGEGPDTGGGWWGEDMARSLEQQRDGIRIYSGAWTHAWLDRLEGFPDTGRDEADAMWGSWAFLEAHSVGWEGFQRAEETPAGAMHDIHPEDRPEIKPKRGHWRP